MSTGYYQKNKGKLEKEAYEQKKNKRVSMHVKSIRKKKKTKSKNIMYNIYLSEYKKQKLSEYRRNYYITLKNNYKVIQ